MEKFAVKAILYSIALVMALLTVAFYLSVPSPPTAAAFTGAGCGGGPPSWGDWVINGPCTCENETVILNGNLRILGMCPPITFTMRNCTILFNVSRNGEYGVMNLGRLEMLDLDNNSATTNDRSSFQSLNESFRYNFTTTDGTICSGSGQVIINNSLIKNTGYQNFSLGYTEIRGTVFENCNGLYLYQENHSIIENNTFSNVNCAINLSNSTNVTITRNIFVNNNASIYLADSVNNSVSDNTIFGGNNAIQLIGFAYGSNYNRLHDNRAYNGTNGGIYVLNSHNNTIISNSVVNNSYGIYLEASENTTLDYNYVYLNRGDGIITNSTTSTFTIYSNTILNNSGWAIWNVNTDPAHQADIQGNTMCFNGNTTYWYASGSDYGGFAPKNNRFCVNITRPIKGGCTSSDEVEFYVDGNPLAWLPFGAGRTNCSLYIDDIVKNYTNPPIRGVNQTVKLSFNGTEIGDGEHKLAVKCDPEGNTAEDEANYTRDTQGPFFNYTETDAECENVTLAVYWYDGCNVSYAILSTNETYSYKNYTNGTYGSPKVIEWNQSWSNFSWWNSSMANKMINWLVWANDSAGNWNHTTNATFLAQPCEVSIVTGGGGGGAAPPPSPCSVSGGNMTIAPVSKGKVVSCYLSNTFRLFNLTFAVKKTETSKITIYEIPQPAGVPNPTVATYKFFNLTALNLTDSDLSKLVVEFVVPNDWMKEKNVVASSVSLFRWDGEGWEAQPTWVKLESSNNTYFYASLYSIETNIFAIAAGKSCPVCPSPTEWSECINGTQTRTEWTCSEETGFECKNFTRTRRCACPECPPPTEWSECINNTQTRIVYTCSEQTGFECVEVEEVRECRPALLFPIWEDFQQAPFETKIAAAVALVAVVAAAALLYFKIKKPSKFWKIRSR